MSAPPRVCFVVPLAACFAGCVVLAPGTRSSPTSARPIAAATASAEANLGLAPSATVAVVPALSAVSPPLAPPTPDAPRTPLAPIVMGSRPTFALSAPAYPRIDRGRRVVTAADTGDDRYAFQVSLSLIELTPGSTRSRVLLQVFARERFDALADDPKALAAEIEAAARKANDALGPTPAGTAMTSCTVAKRETDDAASCASGQTVRCGDFAAIFDGGAGALRHPGGVVRHPLWAKTTIRTVEHRESFSVVSCFREAAWDEVTKTLAARIDRQCEASGGDWCSREPVWTAVTLP